MPFTTPQQAANAGAGMPGAAPGVPGWCGNMPGVMPGAQPTLPLQQPQPSPPPPAAASQQNTVRLDIEVPEGANVGDRLTFNTAAGQFSLVVPQGAAPGKKMMVTMPVPANFATSQPLQVSALRINGQLPAPRYTPEQLQQQKAHRTLVDAHWNKFGAQEKRQVNLSLEMAPYKPASERVVLQPWGFWNFPSTLHDVTAAAEWEYAERGLELPTGGCAPWLLLTRFGPFSAQAAPAARAHVVAVFLSRRQVRARV